jgi:hypothetical protein
MKLYLVLGLVAILSIPQLVLAAPPVPPKALGSVEATIDFCSRVDSKSADKYKEWGKLLVRDMSEKELAEARGSSEYKETYDALSAELEKLPKEKAVDACRASLKESTK